jgi:signal transduction histidine kinase
LISSLLRRSRQIALGVVMSTLALLATQFLRPVLGGTPYFLFLASVVVSAWYGERRGGLTAIVVSLLYIVHFLFQPVHGLWPLSKQESLLLGLFGVVASGVVALTAGRRAFDADLARALKEAEEARRQAEQSSRLKDQFLATLSHELRTPLNAVLGWAHLLASGKVEQSRIPHALASIERNAMAQKQLVDDLLDTSAIVSGRLRLDPKDIDLAEVAGSALDAVRLSMESRNQRLVTDLQSVRCFGDADRLRQVIWNLLSNAAKFTPPGGEIRLVVARAGSAAQIVVADTGRGIRPEFLPHVFDPFRQAESTATRTSGGLGLGLALVRHIVEAHGGRVEVTSAGVGKGATFTVTLSALGPATASVAAPRRESAAQAQEAALRQEKA